MATVDAVAARPHTRRFRAILFFAFRIHRQGLRLLTATNVLGAIAVVFTLLVNLERGYPLLALGGTVLVAAALYVRWIRAGRPSGIEAVEREAEAED
jgi:hypothetical protein